MPYVVMAVMILGWALGLQQGGRNGAESDAWRGEIGEAIAGLPRVLGRGGEWIFISDVDIPSDQKAMLGLNAFVSRSYSRLGVSPEVRATVFIANSRDARGMAGHHPPKCYPAAGWVRSLSPTTGESTRLFPSELASAIPATIYRFERGSENRRVRWVVNGFLMPGGGAVATLAETDGIRARAKTSRFGLTQYQIVIDGDLKMTEVVEYAGEIVGSLPRELLEAVTSTPSVEHEASRGGGS